MNNGTLGVKIGKTISKIHEEYVQYIYYFKEGTLGLLWPLSQPLMDECIDRWKILLWLCDDLWWMNAFLDELIYDEMCTSR